MTLAMRCTSACRPLRGCCRWWDGAGSMCSSAGELHMPPFQGFGEDAFSCF